MKLLILSLLLFCAPVQASYLTPTTQSTVTTTAFTSASGLINVDMLTGTASGWYDTLNLYSQFTADIYTTTTITAGVLTFEQTNDTTNDAAGITLNLQDTTVITQTNVTTYTLAATTVKHYMAPITSRYIRFRFSTALTGTGTCGATVQLKSIPYIPLTTPITQATAASLNATVTATNLSTNVAQFGGTNVVTGGVAGIPSVGGNIAAGTAPTANPLRISGLAFTAQPTARATGTLTDWAMSTIGAGIMKPFSVPALDWQYTSGLSGITVATSTAMKAAGGAGIRNYVTGFCYTNTSATASTIAILDGATVIWAGNAPATMTTEICPIFPTPLQGTAATAMNVQMTTTATVTIVNAQGYQAP
jgi:hypothetical protein